MKQSNLAKRFKALANEQRLALFSMIYRECRKEGGKQKADEGCCAGIDKAFTTACGCLKLSRSTISHHFKELESAGLIRCTRNGQSFICEVNEDALAEMRGFLEK